jgi:hypothetical protein
VRTSPDAAAHVRHRCGGGARAAQILGGASEDGACLARAMRRRRTCSLDFSGVSDSGGASCAPRDDYLADAGLLALEERARRLLGGGGRDPRAFVERAHRLARRRTAHGTPHRARRRRGRRGRAHHHHAWRRAARRRRRFARTLRLEACVRRNETTPTFLLGTMVGTSLLYTGFVVLPELLCPMRA